MMVGRQVTVRLETPECVAAIHHVNKRAFGRSAEADLVDALRARRAFTLSLVAVLGADIIGHILFTPVTVESVGGAFEAVALGPMAVLPQYQRGGVGSELVQVGLGECRHAGHDMVFVLGHAHFYPRFGFVTARSRGIDSEYAVPDEAFMVAELRSGALAGRRGTVKYQPEFGRV